MSGFRYLIRLMAPSLLCNKAIRLTWWDQGEMVVHKILLVDDEQMIAEDFKRTLELEPMFDLTWVASGADAIKAVSKNPHAYSVIVMDYLMPEMSGAETTKQLLKINPDLLITMYSGDQTRDAIKVSHAAGGLGRIKAISASPLMYSTKG